jgi:hypothetical protein
MGGDKRPHALQALTVEPYCQPTVVLLLQEFVCAAVPDLDGAGAVLALGDLALEPCVVEGMVLDVHGEVPLPGLERNPLGDCPGEQDAVALEPEIVVEAASVMALDDEDRPSLPLPLSPEGLRCLASVALALVVAEGGHGRMFIHQGAG